MSVSRQTAFWVAVIVVAIALLALLRDILLPFVAGMAIAYFLDPIVDRLEVRKLPRALATTLVLVLFFVVLTAALLLVAPLIQAQVASLMRELPDMVHGLIEATTRWIERVSSELGEEQMDDARVALRDVARALGGWVLEATRRVFASGLALLNLLGLFLITPVVAWYLLRDWDRLVSKVDGYLPRAQAETIRARFREIDRTLAGFVRGQAIVCVALGTSYALALEIIGLQYGLVVGLFVGVIAIVPFIGALVGLLLSLIFGYLQFGVSGELAAVVVVFLVGQAIESNILTPKLVGDQVGLHPVWIIFALLAGGSLFGFVGVLLAVPVAATVGVLIRFALSRYLAGPLYGGGDPA